MLLRMRHAPHASLLLSLLLSVACDGSSNDHDAATRASSDASTPRACNGHAELCDRRYDAISFPAAHNAHSAREYGYTGTANQISGFQKQLDDGVRVFLIDVYTDGDTGTVFCHGTCALAETSHLEGLRIFKAFLDEHPNEVITFIYEDHVDASLLVQDLETSGLDALVFAHKIGARWPTLGEMIDANTRLLVTAETAGPPPAWLHHVWDVAFDTPYTFNAKGDQPGFKFGVWKVQGGDFQLVTK